MVDLSVIIVNYNVRYFLEQCLMSLEKATRHLNIEVFVVDNDSNDDSVSMVQSRFPNVILIQNRENSGFSVANNQAIALSKGKYVLLLNPDTILSEDTLTTCYDFMESHDDAGAVCVKMIDGSGQYLPESKRGKPTLRASLFKMTGLYRLFPKSSFFNGYYAGNLDENELSSIEVMTGAFMFLRKEVIDKIGILDPAFFMYGEDIDYSVRILEAGYKNYYLPSTTIIHFKGESTKKSSINYTKTFYNAMIIFVKKHYKGRGQLYIMALQLAVVMRALTALLQTWVMKIIPVILDLVLVYFVVIGLKDWWVRFYFNDPYHINEYFERFNAPFYALIWIITAIFMGHYKKFSSWSRVFKSVAIGTGLILIVYGLLDVNLRNSRLLILFGAAGTFLILTMTSFIKNYFRSGTFGFAPNRTLSYAVVGSIVETMRITGLINSEKGRIRYQGRISINEEEKDSIGSIKYLADIIEAYQINEVIFSQKDTPA
ncbi:MAG: glycosyltransferase, partial [Saprospiraceae bacterium]